LARAALLSTRTPAPLSLSLHDALPIYCLEQFWNKVNRNEEADIAPQPLPITPQQAAIVSELQHCVYRGQMKQLFYESKIAELFLDRKSTRLNSSHVKISYAVFGVKKEK